MGTVLLKKRYARSWSARNAQKSDNLVWAYSNPILRRVGFSIDLDESRRRLVSTVTRRENGHYRVWSTAFFPRPPRSRINKPDN